MRHPVGSVLVLIMILASSGVALGQTKVTRYLRFDLTASAGVGSLTNGVILHGEGTIDRGYTGSATTRARTYSVQLPVQRWKWIEHGFQFVPEMSGRVDLKLMGPYETITPDTTSIYQQEVLWDDFKAEGTTLSNPSFETLSGGVISGWSGQGVTQTSPVVVGSRSARTWHNSTLSAALTVTAGVPVTLRFSARAHIPTAFKDMTRIQGRDTPAHKAALKFLRGVNLGNYLEMSPTAVGTQTYSDSDYNLIKAEGFDHVRIPVTWDFYSGTAPAYTLTSAVFTKLDVMINRALARGLNVIVDWHHFDRFMLSPSSSSNQFHAVWEQIAERYKNLPDSVAFELLNEPLNFAKTLVMNRIYPETIRRIRLSNPNRTLFVGPGDANSIDSLNDLQLPDTDSNLIVPVHLYDPFYFTHQATTWTGIDTSTRGVLFPGPPETPIKPASRATNVWVAGWFEAYNSSPAEYNPGGPAAFREKLKRAREWSDYFGRPVQVGEFGAYESADNTSRINFHREIIKVLDQEGLGWAMWDWKAGFHYIRSGVPHPPGMREAIFRPIELLSATAGQIQFDGAVGRTYVVERAPRLADPLIWTPVSTQSVMTPHFQFVDPDGLVAGSSYYRVKWLK